jgi:hypothetical protein
MIPTTWVMCGGCDAELDGVAFEYARAEITPDGLDYIHRNGWFFDGIGWLCPTCTDVVCALCECPLERCECGTADAP